MECYYMNMAVSAKDNNKHVHLAFQTYKWNAANTKKKLTSKVSGTHHNPASKQKALCVWHQFLL